MNVQVKSAAGITVMPVETKLLTSNRCIFIEGEINQESALEFVKSMMILIAEDSSKPINVLVNSPGGDVNAGMLIYDTISSSNTPIRMFCLGRAYSMGALIFLSGQKGRRYMLKNSELMLHEPLIGGKVGGNTTSIKEISDSLIKTRDKLNKIISEHSGKSIEEVEKATDHDHYYSAEESLEFGLCDEVVEFKKIMED